MKRTAAVQAEPLPRADAMPTGDGIFLGKTVVEDETTRPESPARVIYLKPKGREDQGHRHQ